MPPQNIEVPFASKLPDLRTVAGRMKAARLRTGLSTAALARAHGETPTAVRRRESGSRAFPLRHVKYLARRSRCRVSWLTMMDPSDAAPSWLEMIPHVGMDGSVFRPAVPIPRQQPGNAARAARQRPHRRRRSQRPFVVPEDVGGQVRYLAYAADRLNDGATVWDAFTGGMRDAVARGHRKPTGADLWAGLGFLRQAHSEAQKPILGAFARPFVPRRDRQRVVWLSAGPSVVTETSCTSP